MFPVLASCNKFSGLLMREPLDGTITRAVYRGYTGRKSLQRIYT
jgi:hypothetical protein